MQDSADMPTSEIWACANAVLSGAKVLLSRAPQGSRQYANGVQGKAAAERVLRWLDEQGKPPAGGA